MASLSCATDSVKRKSSLQGSACSLMVFDACDMQGMLLSADFCA